VLVTNRVLLFVLWYINVVLILTVVFVLARSLFKLLMERRNRLLGSKFKSKLVATYIGLSLVPVLLLFLYATELLQQSIDRWFAAPVREVLQQGSAVAQSMLGMVEARTLHDARTLAADLDGFELDDLRQRPQLDRLLQDTLQRHALDYLAIYREGQFVHGLVSPRAGLGDLPEPDRSQLAQAALDGEALRIQPPGEHGRLVVGAAAVPSETPAAGVVVTGRVVPPALARQSQELLHAFQAYRQLELQKAEITASQLLLFLMITLLILLAASWTGLYLARRVTVPILALADGTRRISGGDLTHRVEVEADDELGVLVGSFNRMTAELERNKTLLESSNRELTEANRRLAEERALMVAVLQNVAAGVIAIDSRGRVFLVNGAALEMLRQREGEVRGRPLAEAWSDDERGKLLRLLEEGEVGPEGTEVRLVVGGEWRTFEVKATPLGGRDEAAGKVVVLEELTELIKAQQLAAWSDAARRIAHEIKNPLTPIQLAAERMLRRHEQGPEGVGEALEEGVAIIVREVEALKAMVDEFSRFARMPRPQPVEVDLEALVGEVVKLYHGLRDGVEVTAAVAPQAARAWLDPEQLRSALINLLDNAVEATSPPGVIRVEASTVNGRLQLSVADQGRGIEATAKEKLFLPHFSTKGRGTGLGLAIVHRIVSDHHGTIRVEDNQPQGSVFTIELPQR
jgi:two-component system, NtrC family, nitrogen regulation sensor histidine kinase NtrY